MSDPIEDHYKRNDEPAISKVGFRRLIIAGTVIIAALFIYAVYMNKQKKDKIVAEEQSAIQVDTVAVNGENLVGDWSIKIEEGADVTRMAGYIDTNELGGYVLHIVSEYDPKVVAVEITDDGKLYCDELGEGVMTHKKSTDRTTITFEKENGKCILTK